MNKAAASNNSEYLKMAEECLAGLGLEISQGQLSVLVRYVQLLLEELKRQRITGEVTAEEIFEKQIYDSLYPLKVLKFEPGDKMIDVGSGGGFPGLPLKIMLLDLEISLMDSNRKKIAFLRENVKILNLSKIDCLLGRAEDYGRSKEHRASYNYIAAKAVARMNVLAELTLPFLKIGGSALFFKGPRGEEELLEAENAIALCGGLLQESIDYQLPGGEERKLYLVRKVAVTPEEYPRRVGKPTKNPIF